MLRAILNRIRFAIRFRTLGRLAAGRNDPSAVYVCHKGNIVRRGRRCPHQGAPLEKGWIEGDELVCPWHGCRFPLVGEEGRVKPTHPKKSG